MDLRDQHQQKGNLDDIVTTDEGEKASQDFKFFGYVECSAKAFDNCGAVFFEAIRAAKMMKKEVSETRGAKEEKCCTLF